MATHGTLPADGQTGRIAEISLDRGGRGHSYRVRLDDTSVLPDGFNTGGGPWCAVTEMELLEGGSVA